MPPIGQSTILESQELPSGRRPPRLPTILGHRARRVTRWMFCLLAVVVSQGASFHLALALDVAVEVPSATSVPAQPSNEWDEVDSVEQPGAQANHMIGRVWFPDDNNFMQWITQLSSKDEAETAIAARIALCITDAERVCQLTPQQKDRLRLASRADSQRFFQEVDVIRRRLNKAREENDQQFMNEVWNHISPLQMRFQAGLADDRSLFRKVLAKVLTPDQRIRYEAHLIRRNRHRMHVMLRLRLHEISTNLLLTGEQSAQIVALANRWPASSGDLMWEQTLIYFRLAAISDEDLRPILNPEALQQYRAQTQVYLQYRQQLLQSELISQEEADAAAKAFPNMQLGPPNPNAAEAMDAAGGAAEAVPAEDGHAMEAAPVDDATAAGVPVFVAPADAEPAQAEAAPAKCRTAPAEDQPSETSPAEAAP